MNFLRKMAAMMLIALFVFQCSALQAFAVEESLADRLARDGIVLINVAPGADKNADFVRKFPKNLSANEKTMEFPVAEWEIVERRNYDSIPMYFQSDYPDALYGSGTVADCGSGITALAMVATYLTGYEYLPDEMARCFAGKGNEDVARLTNGAKELKLSYTTSEEWTDVFAAIKSGKPVIIQLDRLSVFVDSEEMDAQHFVILTGMTKDGKILVQDPCGAHYVAEELQEGFLSGFSEESVSTGFRYAWIFGRTENYGKLDRYVEKVNPATKSRYTKLALTPGEKQLLARLVSVNASGECSEGQQAMVEVLLNRLLSDKYPNELKELIFGEEPLCEAAALNDAQLTSVQYLVVERALNGPYVLNTDVTEFSYRCHK